MNTESDENITSDAERPEEQTGQETLDSVSSERSETEGQLRRILAGDEAPKTMEQGSSLIHSVLNLPEGKPALAHLLYNAGTNTVLKAERNFLSFSLSEPQHREKVQANFERALDIVTRNDDAIANTLKKNQRAFFIVVDEYVTALRKEIEMLKKTGEYQNLIGMLEQSYRDSVNGTEDGGLVGAGKDMFDPSFFVFLSKKSLLSLYRSIALIDHELGHLSRFQRGVCSSDYRKEEIDNYSQSIQRLERLAAVFHSDDGRNPIEKFVLARERKSLATWTTSKNPAKAVSPNARKKNKKRKKMKKKSQRNNR